MLNSQITTFSFSDVSSYSPSFDDLFFIRVVIVDQVLVVECWYSVAIVCKGCPWARLWFLLPVQCLLLPETAYLDRGGHHWSPGCWLSGDCLPVVIRLIKPYCTRCLAGFSWSWRNYVWEGKKQRRLGPCGGGGSQTKPHPGLVHVSQPEWSQISSSWWWQLRLLVLSKHGTRHVSGWTWPTVQHSLR